MSSDLKKLPPAALLLEAYAQGYFPMPDPATDQILWFRPEPRAILPLDHFHVSRSLKKEIEKKNYTIKLNSSFTDVMQACSERKETWITDEFKRAYDELHKLSRAHSLEIWSLDKKLIGGIYGVQIGGAFFAESMFHKRTNASKLALYHLVEHLKKRKFILLETQFSTPHLASLGVKEVTDLEYLKILQRALALNVTFN